MITIRIKSVNEITNQVNYITTRINCTFLEAIEYYLHQNNIFITYDFFMNKEGKNINQSIELLEG